MPSHRVYSVLAVADKEIAALIGMSVAWVRKDRATRRILPFLRIGHAVRYDVAAVRSVLLTRMEGGSIDGSARPALTAHSIKP